MNALKRLLPPRPASAYEWACWVVYVAAGVVMALDLFVWRPN
jgi:hypothetical protein